MSYRIKALLARLLPRWFKPSLTDEQIRAIYKQAREKQFIKTHEVIATFGQPQEKKP